MNQVQSLSGKRSSGFLPTHTSSLGTAAVLLPDPAYSFPSRPGYRLRMLLLAWWHGTNYIILPKYTHNHHCLSSRTLHQKSHPRCTSATYIPTRLGSFNLGHGPQSVPYTCTLKRFRSPYFPIMYNLVRNTKSCVRICK